MAKYVDGVSMGEIFDEVMDCGIEDSAENRLYMEQALEVFLGERFDVSDFMAEVWSLIALTPEDEKSILEAVYPFEGEQVYSVDTRLVAMVQAAKERTAKAVEREKRAGMEKDDGLEI